MTLNPYHSHKGLLSQVALGGLLAVLIGFIDVKNSMFYGTMLKL